MKIPVHYFVDINKVTVKKFLERWETWISQPQAAATTGAPSAAERSHPTSEVRGSGQEEIPYPPNPEARGGGWEELPHAPKPKARGGGREEQPHTVAVRAQEGLEELSYIEGQEGWRWGDTPRPR